MPRPWEYTPRRFRMMQGIMCAVLCGTLGVAYAVSRMLSVPTGQEVHVGPVSLRLPDDFTLDSNPEADIQAHDANRRLLRIQLMPGGRAERGFSDRVGPIDFRGLSQTGSISIVPRRLSGPEGELLQLTFIATANLPTLKQQIVIELIVIKDEDADLAADQAVIQRIANSVTLSGGPSTPRQRDHSKDTVVLQSIPRHGARL